MRKIDGKLNPNYKHGRAYEKIYKVWHGMNERCTYEKHKDYSTYGGRGIGVEFNDFQDFYDYVSSLENYGVSGYTLDRIDGTDNYKRGNLRWATQVEQARNKGNYKNNSSGVKGVSYHKNAKKYQAYISVNKKTIYLGKYDNIDNAINARKQAELKYWGGE